MAEVGASVGIEFAFDRIARTPNTFDAHRLIRYAKLQGKQDALVELLFRAYFTEGQNIGDRQVLAELAGKAGMARSEAEGFLMSDEGSDEVRLEEERGRRLGIDGVPFFLIDGRVAFSGAQEPEVIAGAITRGEQRAGA